MAIPHLHRRAESFSGRKGRMTTSDAAIIGQPSELLGNRQSLGKAMRSVWEAWRISSKQHGAPPR